MRLLILILLFPFIAQGQIVRTHPYYKPAVITSSCTYILDTYTGSIGAYSVAFKLRAAYSGSAFRVRRSNDNSEQDIGFVGCTVDTASLKSFVGANDGFVVTLYDQEGSNNVTQSTASLQGRIVNAGTIEKINGKVSMYMNGSNHYVFDSYEARTRIDIYFLHSTSDDNYLHFYALTGDIQFSYVATDGNSSTLIISTFGTPSMYANATLFSGTTRNDVHDFLTGTKIVTFENASTSNSLWTTWNFNFGNYSGFQFTGYLSQIIAYDSDQSANRSGIISAFNTQFSVY